jgi:hypothetical protein
MAIDRRMPAELAPLIELARDGRAMEPNPSDREASLAGMASL